MAQRIGALYKIQIRHFLLCSIRSRNDWHKRKLLEMNCQHFSNKY